MLRAELDINHLPDISEPVELMNFRHTFRENSEDINIFAHKWLDSFAHRWLDRGVIFQIKSTQDEMLGFIRGFLSPNPDGSLEMKTSTSMNTGLLEYPYSPRYVPGVISATIAEIVSLGLVSRWNSDLEEKLSDEAMKMYEVNLSSDPRLKVLEPSKETSYRFLVLKS